MKEFVTRGGNFESIKAAMGCDILANIGIGGRRWLGACVEKRGHHVRGQQWETPIGDCVVGLFRDGSEWSGADM